MNRHGSRTLRNGAIGVTLVLGVGAALLARSPKAKEQPPAGEVELELEDGFLRPVRQPLPPLRRATRTVAMDSSAPRPPLPGTISRAATAPEEEMKARIELDRRREQHVIEQFQADSPAIPASKEMERHLASAFEAERTRGVNVKDIECHYRICRVDLMFDTVKSDIAVLRDLFVRNRAPEIANYGSSIAPSREYLPDGRVRTTMYVAREGDFEVID